MKIAITGHRPNKLDNDYSLSSPLIQAIHDRITSIVDSCYCPRVDFRIRHKDLEFISGMALGIDTLFTEIAITDNIPFTAAIPFRGQELRWAHYSQQDYWYLLRKAERVVNVGSGEVFGKGSVDDLMKTPLEPFSRAKMQKRNEWMVDNCDVLIAVWDGTSGGTANCVQYAKKIGRKISYIDPMIVRQELGIESIYKPI